VRGAGANVPMSRMLLRSRPWNEGGTWGPGHLIQRPEQSEPAGEADFLRCSGAVPVSGTGDHSQAAGRRLYPVKDDADLHCSIVGILSAPNIRQPADICDAVPPHAEPSTVATGTENPGPAKAIAGRGVYRAPVGQPAGEVPRHRRCVLAPAPRSRKLGCDRAVCTASGRGGASGLAGQRTRPVNDRAA
jgi:hypothetical protein